MSVKKSDNQVIIDAVVAMVTAMLGDDPDEFVEENSIIGLGPATVLKNESAERLAWICVHPGMLCPQIFLATTDECEYINAPSEGFASSEEAPQIMSPRFQRENSGDGVCGFNFTNDSFSDAVATAAKMVVRWLIAGDR